MNKRKQKEGITTWITNSRRKMRARRTMQGRYSWKEVLHCNFEGSI
jgi:hypothetical protein